MRNSSAGRRRASYLDAWCSRFEASCRERGVRVTPQRLAVYRALAEDVSHPSADALHGKLRPTMPSLSLATVYRILESLVQEGFVRRVGTEDGAARFDANVEAHQHLVCRACDRISDVQSAELTSVVIPRHLANGFRPETLDIRVVGLCDDCEAPPIH